MITRWAIATEEPHAITAVGVLVRHMNGDPFYAEIHPETLRVYETESDGLTALAEFRRTYNETNYVPRSGLVRGAPEDWHLFRVQFHQSAKRVT